MCLLAVDDNPNTTFDGGNVLLSGGVGMAVSVPSAILSGAPGSVEKTIANIATSVLSSVWSYVAQQIADEGEGMKTRDFQGWSQ